MIYVDRKIKLPPQTYVAPFNVGWDNLLVE